MGMLGPEERLTREVALKQDGPVSGEMCPSTYSEDGVNQSRDFLVLGGLGFWTFGVVLFWRKLERNLGRGDILFCSADAKGLVELDFSLVCLELVIKVVSWVMEVVERVGRRVEAMDDHTLRCDGAIEASTAIDISETASSELRDCGRFSVVPDSPG